MRTVPSAVFIIPHYYENCNGCEEISLPARKTGAKPENGAAACTLRTHVREKCALFFSVMPDFGHIA
jgi:hypothetical protein